MNIFLVNSLNCSVSLLFNELNSLFNTPYSSLEEFKKKKKILLDHDLEYINDKLYYYQNVEKILSTSLST